MEKRFEAVEDLIRQAETKAADESDTLALVLIKFAIGSEVDRYLLNGVHPAMADRSLASDQAE